MDWSPEPNAGPFHASAGRPIQNEQTSADGKSCISWKLISSPISPAYREVEFHSVFHSAGSQYVELLWKPTFSGTSVTDGPGEYLITHSFVKKVCFSEASSPGVRSCNQAHWGCPKAQGVEGCLGPGIWLVTSVTLWYDIILSFIIWRQIFWSDTPFSISSGDSFSRVSFTNWMKLGEHCSLNIYKLEQVDQKWGQVEHKPRKNWKVTTCIYKLKQFNQKLKTVLLYIYYKPRKNWASHNLDL